jgi:hypothetical protein
MTEDNKPNETASVAPEEDEILDSDIDQMLSEEDPNFFQSLTEIGKDSFTETQGDLPVEQERLLNRIIFRIKLSLTVARLRVKESAVFLVTKLPKIVLAAVKKFVSAQLEAFSEAQRNFRYLSWKMKLSFFGILLLMLGTGFFIYRSLTHGIVPAEEELFIRSLESVASQVEEYDPKTETEPFYENLRTSSNILLIPKMVVNIKPSKQSGRNPMGAFEFYVEGLIPEVVVEVKDREIEVRDLMQRVVEGFSFDQLDSPEGKQAMTEKLQKEINPLLTTGKIKKIWIKTIILKP